MFPQVTRRFEHRDKHRDKHRETDIEHRDI